MSSAIKIVFSYLTAVAQDTTDERIRGFLKKNPKPSDDQIHALAAELGEDKHKLEERIYKMLGECLKTAAGDSGLKGFVVDIEKETKENKNFRKVLYTGKHSQLVLMTLQPDEDIGDEVHGNLDQFFRVDEGSGKVVINGTEHALKDGSAFIVPGGTNHNVIAGAEGLKLYTLYSPPNHEDGTVHKTKQVAEKSKEKFDGKTTETSAPKSEIN